MGRSCAKRWPDPSLKILESHCQLPATGQPSLEQRPTDPSEAPWLHVPICSNRVAIHGSVYEPLPPPWLLIRTALGIPISSSCLRKHNTSFHNSHWGLYTQALVQELWCYVCLHDASALKPGHLKRRAPEEAPSKDIKQAYCKYLSDSPTQRFMLSRCCWEG